MEALAVGFTDHFDAQKLYNDMMTVAKNKSINNVTPCNTFSFSSSSSSSFSSFSFSSFSFSFPSDWNTVTDDDVLPQLRLVSSAALACYITQCGLASTALTSKPRQDLIDVYRAIFQLRKDIFIQRPVPDNNGEVGVAGGVARIGLLIRYRKRTVIVLITE